MVTENQLLTANYAQRGAKFAKKRLLEERKLAALQGQQLFFDRQASPVAREFTVAANDAVAWDDDGYGIGAVGEADGTRRVGIADASGEFSIGDGFAVRNITQTPPHILLKGRALGSEWKFEGFEVSGEVGAELADSFLQWTRVLSPIGLGWVSALALRELDTTEAGAIAGDEKWSDWTFDLSVASHDSCLASAVG
jgi:hypothetical protein